MTSCILMYLWGLENLAEEDLNSAQFQKNRLRRVALKLTLRLLTVTTDFKIIRLRRANIVFQALKKTSISKIV